MKPLTLAALRFPPVGTQSNLLILGEDQEPGFCPAMTSSPLPAPGSSHALHTRRMPWGQSGAWEGRAGGREAIQRAAEPCQLKVC